MMIIFFSEHFRSIYRSLLVICEDQVRDSEKTSGWINSLFLCISFWWLHEHYCLRFDLPLRIISDWLIFPVKERKKPRLTNKHWMTVDDDVSICTDNILNSAQLRMSSFLFVYSLFCPEELIFVQVPRDPTSYCMYKTKSGFCVVSCWWRQHKQLWGKMITAGVVS
jgi:hypothetical protein